MILCGDTAARTGERAGMGAGTPPPGGKRVEGGEGQSGLRRVVAYVKINNGA